MHLHWERSVAQPTMSWTGGPWEDCWVVTSEAAQRGKLAKFALDSQTILGTCALQSDSFVKDVVFPLVAHSSVSV